MKLILSIGALVCFLTAGCATRYHEPHANSSNPSIGAVAPVWIVKIDGRPVSRISLSGDKRFAISPGGHLLELQYSGRESREYENSYGQRRTLMVGQMSRKNLLLPFTAVAQQHFYVHAGTVANFWKPYINETPPNTFADPPAH